MSKYTTEVRFICETEAGYTESRGFNSVNDILAAAAPKVFNFDFPVFDESYRLPLEIKILRHYYTREISEETVGLWKLRLQDRLNIIMPYYNQLYKSELIEFNPMYDVDLTRDHKRDNDTEDTGELTGKVISTEAGHIKTDGNSSTDSETTDNGSVSTSGTSDTTETVTTNKDVTDWDLYSDTPQGGIDVITSDNDGIADNTYLTNARKKTSNDTTNVNGSTHGSTSGTQTTENTISGSIDITTTEETDTTNNGQTDTTNKSVNYITSTEDYLEHVKGKQGTLSYSKMLEEYRETFLNIDKMILDELSDLFFGLW